MSTTGPVALNPRVPEGSLAEKWENHKFSMNLVSPSNKRAFEIIVVGRSEEHTSELQSQ